MPWMCSTGLFEQSQDGGALWRRPGWCLNGAEYSGIYAANAEGWWRSVSSTSAWLRSNVVGGKKNWTHCAIFFASQGGGNTIFYRPVVAGAILQTAPSFIN